MNGKKQKIEEGVVPFEDFKFVLKSHLVDSLFSVGLPIGWEPYESDRFRAKTKDGKTQISITNWQKDSLTKKELDEQMLANFDNFVKEGGYEPYNDLISINNYISKSFKVDAETQYYLYVINKRGNKVVLTGIIIRDINKYDPQMRAMLLNIMKTIQFI